MNEIVNRLKTSVFDVVSFMPLSIVSSRGGNVYISMIPKIEI